MREEAAQPLLPRRAPVANAGGAAASVEKMRVHVAERGRCTPTQAAMRSRRDARRTSSLLRPMVALGALIILVSLCASRAKLFDTVRAWRGPIDGPSVIFVHHSSLSAPILLHTPRGRESTPFFQSMKDDPNMHVFERHMAGSGNALDAIPALLTGCLPHSEEGAEWAQNSENTIGSEFQRRGYPTASFSSGARDDSVTGEQRDIIEEALVGGLGKAFDAGSNADGGSEKMLQTFEEWMRNDVAKGSPFHAQFHASDLHPTGRDTGEEAYYRNLSATDSFLKSLLDVLSKNGQLENTIVIGSGDHGEDPLRGVNVRMSAWTPDVLHTAGYIYYPRKLMANEGVAETLRRNTQQLTHVVDIVPTIRGVLDGGYENHSSNAPKGCITGVDLTSVDVPDDRVAIATNVASSKRAGVVPARHKALLTKDMALYRRSGKYAISPKTIFNGVAPASDITHVYRFGDCSTDAPDSASPCEGFLKENEAAQEHFRRALVSLQYTALLSEGAKTSDVVRFFAGWLDGNGDIERAESMAGARLVVREDGAIEVVRSTANAEEEPEEEPESAFAKLLRAFQQSPSDDSSCDDILLFMPNTYFADLSPETQLNDYLLASMVASFMDKALVILDAPEELSGFQSNSQFGCPADTDEDLPPGLERLVKVPGWLSKGCAVPCQKSHGYLGWNYVRQSDSPEEVCTNDNGRAAKVFVLGTDEVRDYYYDYFQGLMLRRPSPFAREWAVRLGADPEEAAMFAELEGDEIWDYVAALVARSDLPRFQPWIERDVESYINANVRSPDLDPEGSYDAVYVRRGADVLADPEALNFVINYWEMRGLYNKVLQTAPHNYIPLRHYLRHYVAMGGKAKIYIATNDPEEIEREIAELGPRSGDGVLINSCFTAQFTVSRPRREVGAGSSCADRYASTIASVADLQLLRKSDTFVGEFTSDLGRLVRVFRKTLNDGANAGGGESPVLTKDFKMAWGYLHPGAPGW